MNNDNNNNNSIYTEKELKILNESKTLNSLKTRRNINFIFSLLFIYFIIQNIFYIIIGYKAYEPIIPFVFILIIDIIIFIHSCNELKQYRIIIIKYTHVNNINTNPLVPICNEKISKCKTLLNNHENYYVVKNGYLELRDFLINNKDLLPVETYNNAQKELKFIENEMMNCDLKRK